MEPKMTKAARDELAQAVRKRYRAATGKDKNGFCAVSEFIAVSGYHPKYAIEILNREESGGRSTAEAQSTTALRRGGTADVDCVTGGVGSGAQCGKRLKPLRRILLPALKRNGHLSLDEAICTKVLAMSAASIDRFLRGPKATMGIQRKRRVVPEIRRRTPIRTFAEWHRPAPGGMEMDLVPTAVTLIAAVMSTAWCQPTSPADGRNARCWL